MKKFDLHLFFLLIAALFIWSRDLALIGFYEDVLPVLFSLPLFYLLGAPWVFQKNSTKPSKTILLLAVFGSLAGIIFHSTLFYSIAWSSFFWIWLQARLAKKILNKLEPGFLLLVLGFPWLILEGEVIGWWFRLSGSWVIEQIFSSTGFEVAREGTFLLINDQPFSVETACSGIKSLQSLLIAGIYLGANILGQNFRYIWGLPFLCFIAWIANTIRILIITLAALFMGPEFAMGIFHEIGGLIVIGMMFIFCWFCFCFIRNFITKYDEKILLAKPIVF